MKITIKKGKKKTDTYNLFHKIYFVTVFGINARLKKNIDVVILSQKD